MTISKNLKAKLDRIFTLISFSLNVKQCYISFIENGKETVIWGSNGIALPTAINLEDFNKDLDYPFYVKQSDISFTTLRSNFVDDFKSAYIIPLHLLEINFSGRMFLFNDNVDFLDKKTVKILEDTQAIIIDCLVEDLRMPKYENLSTANDILNHSLIIQNIENGIIITNSEFQIEWSNNAFQKITGYTEQELLNKIPADFLFGPLTSKKTHKKIVESIERKSNYLGEILNYSKHGKPYWINIHVIPILDDKKNITKIITVISDISVKKSLEEKLRRVAELQEFIIDSTNYAIISTDLFGLIKTYNKGTEKTLGYLSEEIVGLYSITKFLVEKELRKLTSELEKKSNWFEGFLQFSLKQNLQEWTFVSKKGKKIPMLISASTLKNRNGEAVGYVFVCADNTEKKIFERKQLEQIEEIEQINNELANANQKASEALKLKDDFIVKISHEIRTPMNGIIGLSNLLMEEPLSKKQIDFVNGINSSGNHLLHIINDLLDISKINAGKVIFEETPFSIELVISNIVNNLLPIAQKKKIEIISLISPNTPRELIGDMIKFNQILFNIIGNAIKFTEKGYVSIDINGHIKNNLFFCETTIKDTGIGIASNMIDKIFENFVQAQDDTNRLYGGTGLGLSISKQLIEAQGGNIEVTSQLGSGTEFKFILPFKIAKSKTKSSIEDRDTFVYKSTTFLSNKRVLIAEDNNINLLVITNVLKKWGAMIRIAQDGKEVIDILKNEDFDLILMDLQMPVLDGLGATKIIRNELNLNIPIIAMTANALIGEDMKCIGNGMQGYVSKPFKPLELKSAIQKCLNIEEQSNYNIDLTLLKEISGGNTDVLNDMLTVYLTDLPTYINELSTAIGEKNMKLVSGVSHKIKSSILLIGINALESDFEYIETYSLQPEYENECILKAENLIEVCNTSMEQVKLILKSK